jgi:hypothetical protein
MLYAYTHYLNTSYKSTVSNNQMNALRKMLSNDTRILSIFLSQKGRKRHRFTRFSNNKSLIKRKNSIWSVMAYAHLKYLKTAK